MRIARQLSRFRHAWPLGAASLAGALIAILAAAPAEAQSSLRLHTRVDMAQFSRSERHSSGTRPGLALAVESGAEGSAGRIVLAYAPASENGLGWKAASFEVIPYFLDQPGILSVGLRLMGGALHISKPLASRRSCQPVPVPCFSDGGTPAFGSGWAAILGASAELVVPVGTTRWAFAASFGLGYLLGGENGESRARISTVGIRYAWK